MKPLLEQEEIIDTLNDVLGVDKYAMDNVVFPEQEDWIKYYSVINLKEKNC